MTDPLECPDCGDYTPDGSWCEKCLDEVDIEAHEESRRDRLFEEQEYCHISPSGLKAEMKITKRGEE